MDNCARTLDRQKLDAARSAAQARKWTLAADAFRAGVPAEFVDQLSLQDQLLRNLSLNMSDLAAHRPEVFSVLQSSPTDNRFSVDITPSGRPTILCQGRSLSQSTDPLVTLASTMKQLGPARHAAKPMAILGTADGYLLTALARHPVKLPPPQQERQQCVYLVEPNPSNLLFALMIHDMSGDIGPICQPRFKWFVAPGVAQAVAMFEQAMAADLYLSFPELNVSSYPDGPQLTKLTEQVLMNLAAADAHRARQLAQRYSSCEPSRFTEMLGPNPPRKPRALFLTTRYSTVLQYSTRDCAEGLREIGWEAEVAIEPTHWHSLTIPAMRDLMLRFDPDIIIQLDHYRAEHGTGDKALFPPEIPFICWAQDNLATLTHPDAGAAHGPRDFFLTALGDWYTRDFGYPRESIVPLHKLTRVPSIPKHWESNGPDLTYVSNASKTPEVAAQDLVAYYGHDKTLQRILEGATQKVLAEYARGGSFCGPNYLVPVVLESAREISADTSRIPHMVVMDLWERLNNVCYRQQALGWIAEVADESGLNLALYGNGWDKHPRFSRYAAGYAAYGDGLETLTRDSKINLQIVPYFCLHQRLLDGLAAGGFFLVREHPSDTAIRELTDFVSRHFTPDVRTLQHALQVIAPDLREAFERTVSSVSFFTDMLDPMAFAWSMIEMELFPEVGEMPPRIGEVSFKSKADFSNLVQRFLRNPELRRQIALEQRDATVSRLSYRAGMKRVMRQIRDRLALHADREKHAA